MNTNGIIRRAGDAVIVEVSGATDAAGMPGVECLNPDATPEARIYRKWFVNKRVRIAGEAGSEVLDHPTGSTSLVLGMNGYSRLTPEQCLIWGVAPGAYEAACRGILRASCDALRERFPEMELRLVHGASDMGVDRAIIEVARALNVPRLGFSCPEFMLYVTDDDEEVYVAPNRGAYADAFVRALDVLIAANGREHAFRHDLDAAFRYAKHLVPINVLRAISSNGGPPAFGPNGQVEDAVAAFEERVFLVSQRLGRSSNDPWGEIVRYTQETLTGIGRRILAPEVAFNT